MERFKVVERETKTKAYSKEGMCTYLVPLTSTLAYFYLLPSLSYSFILPLHSIYLFSFHFLSSTSLLIFPFSFHSYSSLLFLLAVPFLSYAYTSSYTPTPLFVLYTYLIHTSPLCIPVPPTSIHICHSPRSYTERIGTSIIV